MVVTEKYIAVVEKRENSPEYTLRIRLAESILTTYKYSQRNIKFLVPLINNPIYGNAELNFLGVLFDEQREFTRLVLDHRMELERS